MNGQPRRAYSYWAYSGLALSSKPPSLTPIARTGLETRLEDCFAVLRNTTSSPGSSRHWGPLATTTATATRTTKNPIGLD